jgi:uncharacterized protein YdiU (UPF0061 family)
MNTENKNPDNLDNLFNSLNGQWDTEEPDSGHEDRFLYRLEGRKKKSGLLYKLVMPAAAAIAILLGIMITYTPTKDHSQVAISPKTEQTQLYFASIIQKELAKVEKENSPETKMLVQDALRHMEQLEKDYTKITHELAEKGENKQLLHAMITNLQTRISFLEDVVAKIENIKKIKENYHDNNQA